MLAVRLGHAHSSTIVPATLSVPSISVKYSQLWHTAFTALVKPPLSERYTVEVRRCKSYGGHFARARDE